MRDLKLTDSHDLDLSNADLNIISGSEETAQNINIGILFIRGEYVFDLQRGVPWLDGMFGSEWLGVERDHEIHQAILNREGVRKINQFRYTVDTVKQTGFVQYAVETLYGTSISTLPISLYEEEEL